MKSNSKHLNKNQRDKIEVNLNCGCKLCDLADSLKRDPRGIQKEIIKHRKIVHLKNRKNKCGKQNSCTKTRVCEGCTSGKCKFCSRINCNDFCDHFCTEPDCPTCNRFPYVCNACDKINTCPLPKFFYKAAHAQKEYEQDKLSWRSGTRFDEKQLKHIDKIISDGVKRGLSLDVIINTNKVGISVSTAYRLINQNMLSVKNIDLKRKVRYKTRKPNNNKEVRVDYEYRKGRTFEDFQEYFISNPSANIWQMDTIEGIKGGDAVLTLLHTKTNLQLYFKLKTTTTNEVVSIIDSIKDFLSEDVFREIFECILTDNGKEFKDPLRIETSPHTGEVLCKVFYCDARRSDQKAECEKNHEHFREFIPKGVDITPYTKIQINQISRNINNYPRKMFNYKSPIESYLGLGLNKKTLELNRLYIVPSNKVTLKRLNPH